MFESLFRAPIILGAPLLFATAASAQSAIPLTVDLNSTTATVQVDTSLGQLTLDVSVLQPFGTTKLIAANGDHPISTCVFVGGGSLHLPVIHGEIPNPIPILPPLLDIEINNLELVLESGPCPVNIGGDWTTLLQSRVLAGTLSVKVLDVLVLVLDLGGNNSDFDTAAGSLLSTSLQLDLDLATSLVVIDLNLNLPTGLLDVALKVDLTLGAFFGYPEPERYCSTSPNSVGPGSLIFADGTTSISENNLVMRATSLPHHLYGAFYFGPTQVQFPFGNGWRCVGGGTVRMSPVNSGGGGVVIQHFDFTDLPSGATFGPGDSTNIQYWYRDPDAGGATFNLSDALELFFVP